MTTKFKHTEDDKYNEYIIGLMSMLGRQYVHYKNKNTYTVVALTNLNGSFERLEDHPIDVIYMGYGGDIWSRRLDDWDRSFTLKEEINAIQIKK